MKLYIIIFVAFFSKLSRSQYVIPDPKFEIYRNGFSVSVPHEEGITLFAFHGNINKQMHGLEAGQFSRDILRRSKSDGRWKFTDFSTKLNTGDVIYYWLFVIRDGLGYRYDDGVYTVNETHPYDLEHERHRPSNRCEFDIDLFNLTKSFIALKNEVEKLKEINEILSNIVENIAEKTHSLKFTGTLPPFDDSLEIVESIVKDKLGVDVKVESAKRNDDGTISFNVKGLKDKINIIGKAREKLKDSKIGLSY